LGTNNLLTERVGGKKTDLPAKKNGYECLACGFLRDVLFGWGFFCFCAGEKKQNKNRNARRRNISSTIGIKNTVVLFLTVANLKRKLHTNLVN